jgi:hypothetical protein
LSPTHEIIALERSVRRTIARRSVDCRRCGLYDVEQAATSLEGAPSAVYLVHEMVATRGLELQRAAGFECKPFDVLVKEALSAQSQSSAAPPSSTAVRAVVQQR